MSEQKEPIGGGMVAHTRADTMKLILYRQLKDKSRRLNPKQEQPK